MILPQKERMFTCDEWAEMYDKANVSGADIEKAVGIKKAVFLRAVMPNGKRIDIPYKYEMPLYKFFKSRLEAIANPYPVQEIKLEDATPEEKIELADEEMQSKLDWIKMVRDARSNYMATSSPL